MLKDDAATVAAEARFAMEPSSRSAFFDHSKVTSTVSRPESTNRVPFDS